MMTGHRERGNFWLRFFDRYVGIPCLWILGLLLRKKLPPARINAIGVLKTAAIGDTIILTAAIQDLRRSFPHADIVLFTGASNYAVAKLIGGVNKVVVLPIRKPLQSFWLLRQYRFDVFLDFGTWPRINALFSFFSCADYKVGFQTRGQYRHYIYDNAVKHSSQIHEVENYRNILRALGIVPYHFPKLIVPKQPIIIEDYRLEDSYVVLHLWAGGSRRKQKEWPLDRWVRLAEAFIDIGYQIVLTGSSSDKRKNAQFARYCDEKKFCRIVDVAGCAIVETAYILSKAKLLVSVDTGVMHMASALGIPLVAMHGPTSSKRWGALNDQAIIVNSPLSGCGYINLGFERSDVLDCMRAISFDMVWDACKRFAFFLPEGRQRRVSIVQQPGEMG